MGDVIVIAISAAVGVLTLISIDGDEAHRAKRVRPIETRGSGARVRINAIEEAIPVEVFGWKRGNHGVHTVLSGKHRRVEATCDKALK